MPNHTPPVLFNTSAKATAKPPAAGRWAKIGRGLLASGDLGALAPGRHVMLVSDSHVAPLYLDRARALIDAGVPLVPAGIVGTDLCESYIARVNRW
mgnify:CR=1 FL=1